MARGSEKQGLQSSISPCVPEAVSACFRRTEIEERPPRMRVRGWIPEARARKPGWCHWLACESRVRVRPGYRGCSKSDTEMSMRRHFEYQRRQRDDLSPATINCSR